MIGVIGLMKIELLLQIPWKKHQNIVLKTSIHLPHVHMTGRIPLVIDEGKNWRRRIVEESICSVYPESVLILIDFLI